MPCNLTAFILGFILKEYANSGVYSYSDNLTTVPLDADKLASMISEIIKQENTPNKHYKDKYIVTLTDEERAFNKATSTAFGIEEKYCVSITETRSRIRDKMKSFSFPIWLIQYAIDDVSFKTNKDIVCDLIDNYCGIANNKNMEGEKSDNDIALIIGRICIDNPEAVEDLKSVLTKDNCKNGMIKYLELYRDGLLPSIAKTIDDGGQYINRLAYKFDSDAANWVWNKDTVHGKIDEFITEYEIVEISNKILIKHTSYQDTIREWCTKIEQIRLAYSVIKNELGDAKPFYEMLYNLKKANNLLDSQKKQFLELLKVNVDSFKQFMMNQSSLFMRSILQGYLEYGKFNANGYDGESDAGLVFLGNIQKENMDEFSYMLEELPKLFQETALLDRIHGFVKGWDIPRMNDSLKITGWALNSEYFCSIMHELRNDMSYRTIVERIVEVPERADTRDTEAIKRIATAYLKLLFPHVRSEYDVDKLEFNDYCLIPAMKMRRIIKLQQGMIDSEYKGKDVPLLTVKDYYG